MAANSNQDVAACALEQLQGWLRDSGHHPAGGDRALKRCPRRAGRKAAQQERGQPLCAEMSEVGAKSSNRARLPTCGLPALVTSHKARSGRF